MSGIIQKLDETVVNRIAAGEVVQRPANALKEMLENSLDAKSTQITVTVKQGGLKLLQIQDNGTGIHKSDMIIVCERFTTSKLKEFEDLQSISTYGFRGEALASISHVAHLTIVTKTKSDQCAWKCSYIDGKPSVDVKPCAGNQGTQINVEDLFYNVTTRRKALKSPAEENSKIAEVVSRYAIHNSKVGFCLKRLGESGVDLRTPPNSTAKENIRIVFGSTVAKELLEMSCSSERLHFSCSGLISNANYSTKKCIMLLFINNRLVDCTALRKALENIYSCYLPKQSHPFIYLSVEIAPQNVDVNVHPTKHEVSFLHEDGIIEAIQKAVEQTLLGSNQSRVFYAQKLLPGLAEGVVSPVGTTELQTPDAKSKEGKEQPKVYDHSLVRTQHKEQKLTKFLENSQTKESSTVSVANVTCTEAVQSAIDDTKRDIKLSSVKRLRDEVTSVCHKGVTDIVKNHTFVGCVDNKHALVQHNTHLFLCHTSHLCEQMFYQLILKDFGNLGIIKLTTPLSIKELSLLALDQPESGWSEVDGPKEQIADYIVNFLSSKAPMLLDYFSLTISDGNVCTLPYVIEGFTPVMAHLPIYLMKLTTEVNWADEEECFRTFAMETAKFYASPPFIEEQQGEMKGKTDKSGWCYKVETVLYPALKKYLLPPQYFSTDSTLLQLADLKQLYKVFERC